MHGSGFEHRHGQDVEPIRSRRPEAPPEFSGGPFDPHAFGAGDGVFGVGVAAAGLHFDEDQRSSVIGHDVDFAFAGDVRAGEEQETLLAKKERAFDLGTAAERQAASAERPVLAEVP